MKRILLTGRYAVGNNRFALVDDDLAGELGRCRWKAKPNGSRTGVYAVRTVRGADGVCRDLRMHRVVLQYEGPLDVDHINGDPLDNRRENLRVITRQENQRDRRKVEVRVTCRYCGRSVVRSCSVGSHARLRFCSTDCADRGQRLVSAVYAATCALCRRAYIGKRPGMYCGEACRKKAKRERQLASGALPPSQRPATARASC